MNEDTKLKIVVAASALVVTAVGAGIARQFHKRKLKKPLPGTTKIEKIYVIKEKIPTK